MSINEHPAIFIVIAILIGLLLGVLGSWDKIKGIIYMNREIRRMKEELNKRK